MKKLIIVITCIFTFLSSCNNSGKEDATKAKASDESILQEQTLKEQAIEAFKKEHYPEAIALMEEAQIQSPDDAEVYFYLGWFHHYRASDSRLLAGYDAGYSQKILDYLDKALILNPQLGDAKYFYGAECGTAACIAMQNYDVENLKYFYQKAYEKGALPPWMIEFGKNFMNACDENAIVFTIGDAEFNTCMYLQLHQNHRTDLTIIALGIIDRPWYVKFLKDGLEGGVRKINLNLTDAQIMDIRPFKWDTTDVYIPISEALKTEFNLPQHFSFCWTIEPDLTSNITRSVIAGQAPKRRAYLSPRQAMLLQIIEDNFSERPIYFSRYAPSALYGGLEPYFQHCGMTYRLTPVEKIPADISKMETLFNPENFAHLPSIKTDDMPRVSSIIYNYYDIFTILAKHYKQTKQEEKLQNLIEIYKKSIAIGYDEEEEEAVLKEVLSIN